MPGVKFKAAIFAVMVAALVVPEMANTASALPLERVGQTSPEANAENSNLLVDATYRSERRRYIRRYNGDQYSYRRHGYNHYRGRYYGNRYPYRRYPYYGYGYGDGYGYGSSWIGFGVPFFGFGYDDYGYDNYGGGGHVRWCLNRYRSYDPRSDTYLGYDGHRHFCRSPY